ncbi:hypothetical protein FRB90_005397 [Tulasnella sp. 427]|nr:hypothetical protein FRB90_005397 [Tulasnella sp. 427]
MTRSVMISLALPASQICDLPPTSSRRADSVHHGLSQHTEALSSIQTYAEVLMQFFRWTCYYWDSLHFLGTWRAPAAAAGLKYLKDLLWSPVRHKFSEESEMDSASRIV